MQDDEGHWHDWYEGDGLCAQNDAFCAAMMRALQAGHEQVPMLGVDTRPGTQHPQMMGAATPANWGSWLE